MAWWGSPTHDANGASRGVPRAYNQRYNDDQRPTGGTAEAVRGGFRHVHRRRTRAFGGCPGCLDRQCCGCLSVGRAGVGARRRPAPTLELVSPDQHGCFPPPSRGAGGAAGGVELIPELSTMRGVLFLKNMMVVRYQWVIQVVPVGDTTSRVMHHPLIHLLIF